MHFKLKKHLFSFCFEQHLRGKGDFDRAIRQGKRHFTRDLKLFYHPNDLEYSRLGLILAKKNIKRAVDRNRVKRQLKEGFRLTQVALPSMDFVIMGYRGLAKMDRATLHRLVVDLWQSLSVSS